MDFLWFLIQFPPLRSLTNFLLLGDSNNAPAEGISQGGHGHEGDMALILVELPGRSHLASSRPGMFQTSLWHHECQGGSYLPEKHVRMRHPVFRTHLVSGSYIARQALSLLLLTTWLHCTSGRKWGQ